MRPRRAAPSPRSRRYLLTRALRASGFPGPRDSAVVSRTPLVSGDAEAGPLALPFAVAMSLVSHELLGQFDADGIWQSLQETSQSRDTNLRYTARRLFSPSRLAHLVQLKFSSRTIWGQTVSRRKT